MSHDTRPTWSLLCFWGFWGGGVKLWGVLTMTKIRLKKGSRELWCLAGHGNKAPGRAVGPFDLI
jgi:hypothetical protein